MEFMALRPWIKSKNYTIALKIQAKTPTFNPILNFIRISTLFRWVHYFVTCLFKFNFLMKGHLHIEPFILQRNFLYGYLFPKLIRINRTDCSWSSFILSIRQFNFLELKGQNPINSIRYLRINELVTWTISLAPFSGLFGIFFLITWWIKNENYDNVIISCSCCSPQMWSLRGILANFSKSVKTIQSRSQNFQVKIEINHLISSQIHFNWNDMNPAARGLKNRFQHKLIPLSYVWSPNISNSNSDFWDGIFLHFWFIL